MALRRKREERTNPLLSEPGFSDFYTRHSRSMLLFFTRRVRDSEVALDLTAETFAQAFLGRRRFHGSNDAESARWLYGIARHQLSRYFRRGRAEQRAVARLGIEVPALTADAQERIEELADMDQLREATSEGLARLSQRHQEALRLRVVDELPYPEVARRLGVSEQTARMRVSRALRALARALDARTLPEGRTR